jgi:hypothetical protein
MRVRVKKDDKLVNIKLSNGCLQLTGAKTAEAFGLWDCRR